MDEPVSTPTPTESTPQPTDSTPQGTPQGAGSVVPTPSNAPTSTVNWYDSLSDDLKADQNITKFTNVEELAKGYKNASQLIGRDKIPMPKTDSEMHEVQIRLGKPVTSQEYKIGPELGTNWQIDDLAQSPEAGVDLDTFKQCYKKRCHEFGLTQGQAAKVYETLAREEKARDQQRNTAIDVEMAHCGAQLKKEWGEQHEINLIVAGKTLHQVFGKEVASIVDAVGLGRHPEFIKGLHKIGSRSLEELGIDKRGTSLKTPSDLDSEISSLTAHPAYFDKAHPEHSIVVNKVTALMQRRYPEPARA